MSVKIGRAKARPAVPRPWRVEVGAAQTQRNQKQTLKQGPTGIPCSRDISFHGMTVGGQPFIQRFICLPAIYPPPTKQALKGWFGRMGKGCKVEKGKSKTNPADSKHSTPASCPTRPRGAAPTAQRHPEGGDHGRRMEGNEFRWEFLDVLKGEVFHLFLSSFFIEGGDCEKMSK